MEITQAQKYEILEHELLNGAGLEEILKKCLEILMKSEREIHNENYFELLPRLQYFFLYLYSEKFVTNIGQKTINN